MQAYDVKELLEKLKARGLDLTEELAKGALEDVFGWLESSAKASATKWDDMALIVLDEVRAKALPEIDKIDGKVG